MKKKDKWLNFGNTLELLVGRYPSLIRMSVAFDQLDFLTVAQRRQAHAVFGVNKLTLLIENPSVLLAIVADQVDIQRPPFHIVIVKVRK